MLVTIIIFHSLRLIVIFGTSEPPPDHIVELYERRIQLGLPVGFWDGVEAALGMSIMIESRI